MNKQEKIAGAVLAIAALALVIVSGVLYMRQDRTAPIIEFRTTEIIYREGMDQAGLLTGAAAYDNEDGEITERIVIEKIISDQERGQAVVFYAVSDSAGNVAKASRVFTAAYEEYHEAGAADAQAEGFMEAGIAAELGKDPDVPEEGAGPGLTPEPEDMPERAGEAAYTSPDRQGDSDEPASGQGETPAPESTERTVSAPEPTERAVSAPEPSERAVPAPETVRVPAQQPDTEPVPEPAADSAGPVLTLKTGEVTVKAGQGPVWVDLIETLTDDKDSYETLFGNLKVGKFDREKPGTYQISVYTEDSDGNQSAPVPLTIIVQ